MDAPDLQVACRPSPTHDGDVAFVAERLVPSSSVHWVLRFWVDDEPGDTDGDAGTEPGSPLRPAVTPLAA